MRPDYFIAGFYKCGTTTLYDVLSQHKDIIVSNEKENDFFMDERLYGKGINWYEDKYYSGLTRSEGQVVMEINPHLSGRKGTAYRIKRYYPQGTKILFIMRNPVKMFYSHFRFSMQLGMMPFEDTCYAVEHGFSSAFDQYLKKWPDAYKSYTRHFSVQIQEYIECFGSESVHCMFLEDMQKNANLFYSELYDFFGLDFDDSINYNVHSNETNAMPTNVIMLKAYAALRKWRKSGPECRWEGQSVFLDKIQAYLYRVYDKSIPMESKMNVRTEKKLQRGFDCEKKRIETIVGYKLDDKWW